jgi:hypothetical protein
VAGMLLAEPLHAVNKDVKPVKITGIDELTPL